MRHLTIHIRGGRLAVISIICLLGLPARAQVGPPRTPVYPPPAPLPADTAASNQIGQSQEFAVPTVLGSGPSKGIVAHYERLSNFSINTKLRDQDPEARATTTVTKNARAFIKAYAPLINHPHLKLILGVNNGSGVFSGTIQNTNTGGGGVAIVKNGTGTQTFTGPTSYSGGTTVNGGRLIIQNSGTGSGNFVVDGDLELHKKKVSVQFGFPILVV